jgi:malonate-semialdehyde dehydrogenase (acetylating)/methylmalonate-semialdehyde dehydrogenase
MDKHFDELAALVTREHGKTLAEAKAEVKRGLEMVEFSCGIPSIIMGETLPNIAIDVDGETNRHPVGVCVGITPYNFPSMVPLWMFPVAITCGNTFVLKPSEKVPLSSARLAELLQEADLPDGVFNIVHGDKECVDALLKHPDVAAISFVGSTRVAHYIYEVGSQHGKRVQSAGGAKNHLIIMPDADIEQASKALAASGYGCAGQRCMAGSVALTVGSAGDPLVESLCQHAGGLKVGPTDNGDDVDMGPLINPDAVHRVASYLDLAEQEGAEVALDGREKMGGEGFVIGPSVVDKVQPKMKLANEEIFGPLLSVIRTDDLEQAIEIGANCPYGNGASIFTNDGRAAREFKRRFNAGMLGINIGVPAPMPWLPFTGWNRSFFGDLHIQGKESVHFYTKQKMTLTRWFESAADSHHDPVWASKHRNT